ncbi:MAG: DUF4864 domain-containing protein [Cereibacter sphaeroides]|uniref:DUF4864 domain-containing protein n=1 Tax=Cereibacter sphaeroides TaxID=1063 RepID=A0A2W5SIE8_CERSP|nr:MAG: DUF4864 domain-containing protein [Cereibacter sphaeroides]
MRQMLLSLFLLFSVTLGAVAQDAREPAIAKTIQSQIDAFQEDDFATAFSFASPNIKGLFGSPERFGQMVKEGYPMVWRPSGVRFLELREVAGGLWQRVMVTDQSGRTHMLDYEMVETSDGWQINAVQLLRNPGVGA